MFLNGRRRNGFFFFFFFAFNLSGFEKQNGNLSEVKINEMLGLVGHIGSKVSAHDTMPSRVIFLVKFFFDVGRDIFLDVVSL